MRSKDHLPLAFVGKLMPGRRVNCMCDRAVAGEERAPLRSRQADPTAA